MNKQQYFELVTTKRELQAKREEASKILQDIVFEGTEGDMKQAEANYKEVADQYYKAVVTMTKAQSHFTKEELRQMKKEYEAA